MFLSRNKKNIDTFWLKNAPYQELCLELHVWFRQLRVFAYLCDSDETTMTFDGALFIRISHNSLVR